MKTKDGKELNIRKAQRADAPQILEYLNMIGGESDNLLFGENEFSMTVEGEEAFIDQMTSSTGSTMLIGKIDGEIVCVGSLASSLKKRISHYAELAISVQKKYWGLGVGTQLMHALISSARKNGQTKTIELGVKADNIAAIGLYQKMGFAEIGRHQDFFHINGSYYDEILMDLHLS